MCNGVLTKHINRATKTTQLFFVVFHLDVEELWLKDTSANECLFTASQGLPLHLSNLCIFKKNLKSRGKSVLVYLQCFHSGVLLRMIVVPANADQICLLPPKYLGPRSSVQKVARPSNSSIIKVVTAVVLVEIGKITDKAQTYERDGSACSAFCCMALQEAATPPSTSRPQKSG